MLKVYEDVSNRRFYKCESRMQNLPHVSCTRCLDMDVGLQQSQLVSMKGSMNREVALEPHVPLHWVRFTLSCDLQPSMLITVSVASWQQSVLGSEGHRNIEYVYFKDNYINDISKTIFVRVANRMLYYLEITLFIQTTMIPI